MVLFDVPIGQNTHRERLRRYLRDKGFGYLQNSVWITPDPLEEELQILRGGKINVESLILAELDDSALFALRFRQNAARALLLPRSTPGKRANSTSLNRSNFSQLITADNAVSGTAPPV